MHITVLVDNISDSQLQAEWGLSLLIKTEQGEILLDTGGSDAFLRNAQKLGIDLERVDYAVLSHAHYDHANGMEAFFTANSHAPLYLEASTQENCYGDKENGWEYIGIPRGVIERYSKRIMRTHGLSEIVPGVHLLSHSTCNTQEIGAKQKLYVRDEDSSDSAYIPDDFCHEHTLVIETTQGLIIFNSCSHIGADNIVKEVQQAFPEHHIYAYVGGLHLYTYSDEEVEAFGKRVAQTGLTRLITGHCTGQRGFDVLKETLAGQVNVQQFKTGLVFEL